MAAPRWPNDISYVADNEIFKNRAQTSSVASAVWHVAASSWNQMLPISSSSMYKIRSTWPNNVQHSPIIVTATLLTFEEKLPNYASELKWLVLGALFNVCMRAGFLCHKCENFACLHITCQDQNGFHPNRWLFLPKSASSVSRSQAHIAKRKHIVWSIGFNSWTTL